MTKKESNRIANTMKWIAENVITKEVNNEDYYIIWCTDGFLGDELVLPKEDESTTFLGFAWLSLYKGTPANDYILRCRITSFGTIHVSVRDIAGNRIGRQSFFC